MIINDRFKPTSFLFLLFSILYSLNKRLLHQGASAIDIIQQYITCIKCLKMFDPSCQLLFPVVELVEQYMM